MKHKIALTVIAAALQLAVALLPFIPVVKTIIIPANPTPREQLDAMILCFGVSFTIMTSCLGILALLQETDVRRIQSDLRELSPCRIKKLRDDTFYADFLAAVSQAQSHVYISYLATYPPDDTGHDERKRYYKKLLEFIKKTPNVKVRRLLRRTPDTEAWIKGLLKALEGCPNADVAILDESPKDEMPLALSVQIVDGKSVWFVALDSHERKGEYRDLFIENATVGEAMEKYLTRLWQRSTQLLDAGRITVDGEAIGKRHPRGGTTEA